MTFTIIQADHIRSVKRFVYNKVFDTNIISPILYKDYKDIVFSGGMFASVFLGEEPRDLDVFILNENRKVFDIIANTNDKGLLRDRHPYLVNPNIKSIFEIGKVQVILTDYKTREELINHFDYQHCCVSIGFGDFFTGGRRPEATLYITPNTYHCIMNKYLVPHNGNKPAEWRKSKFLGKGWRNLLSQLPICDGPLTNPCSEIVLSDVSKTTLSDLGDILKDWA